MKLYGSFTSPYVRRVRALSHVLHINNRMEWIPASPYESPQLLLDVNPLSRIPTLITDEGQIIPDSAVIADYLCANFNGEQYLPVAGEYRWQILHLATLAEGIIDLALYTVMIRRRNTGDTEKLLRHQQGIERTLQYLATNQWVLSAEKPTFYEITLGCALGYLQFRLPDIFAATVPSTLNTWFAAFEAKPFMHDTQPRES